jgi:hypothetical protein
MFVKTAPGGIIVELTHGEAIALRDQLADLPAKTKPLLRQLDQNVYLAQESYNQAAAGLMLTEKGWR